MVTGTQGNHFTCGINNYYYLVTEKLRQHVYSEEWILAVHDRHKSSYLLIMKNGVSADDFAERLLLTNSNMYILDKNLPASGYRGKNSNESLVLFSLKERPTLIVLLPEDDWHFNMAVDTEKHTYNAEIRRRSVATELSGTSYTLTVDNIEVPDEAIEALLSVANDPGFISLKSGDLFPDVFVLDGTNVLLDIRSKVGRFRMEDNRFMMTEDDGIIRTSTSEYQTGIHLIRKAISEALGEELTENDDDNNE